MMANQIFPMGIELLMSSVTVWYFCGWPYFLNSIFSFYLYGKITKNLAMDRKIHIQKNHQIEKDIHLLLNESLSNYYNIRIFGCDMYEKFKYTQKTIQNVKNTIASNEILCKMNFQQKLVIVYGMISNMGLAIYQVSSGQMLIGTFIFLNILLAQVYGSLFNAGNIYRMWQESFASLNDFINFYSQKPKINEKADAKEIKWEKGLLEFRDLTFSFKNHLNEKIYTIKRLNLRINPGEKILITGESGSGKTTLINILLRFYDQQEGVVLIDG